MLISDRDQFWIGTQRSSTTPVGVVMPLPMSSKAVRPLRYRLPNPPPLFVGRRQEVKLLSRALERAPMSVVCGLGGIGKTSLALHTLHTHFRDAADSALYLRLGSSVTSGDLGTIVVQAVTDLLEPGKAEERGSLNQDTLVATAIELAERGRHWIVLDDVHLIGTDSINKQVDLIARYARHSRWLVISRVRPQVPNLEAQTVDLSGLEPKALTQLARAWMPRSSRGAIDETVAKSAGSPWLLRYGAARSFNDSETINVLDGLSERAELLVTRLSALLEPVSESVLTRLCSTEIAAPYRELEARGLVDRTPDGYVRLHDVARVYVRRLLNAQRIEQTEQQVAQILAAESDSITRLECLRLHLSTGNQAAFERGLTTWGDRLIQAGYAQQLAGLIDSSNDGSLEPWRFRVALELNQVERIRSFLKREPTTAADFYLTSRAHLMLGEPAQAAEAAAEATSLAPESDDPEFADRCLLVAAEALDSLMDYDAAHQRLDLIRTAEGDLAIRRDAIRLNCWVLQNRLDEAETAAAALATCLPGARIQTRAFAARILSRAYNLLGQPREALALLDRLASDPLMSSDPNWLDMLYLRSANTMEDGRLREAAAQRAPLQAFMELSPRQRPYHLFLEGVHRFTVGELNGLEQILMDARQGYLDQGRLLSAIVSTLYVGMLNAMRGRPEFPGLDSTTAVADDLGAFLIQAGQLEVRIRRGEVIAAGQWPQHLEVGDAPVELNRLRALSSIARGEPDAAVRYAREAALLANTRGEHLREIDVVQLVCEALVVQGEPDALAATARGLGEMAERFGSRRLATESRFFSTIVDAADVWPGDLEEIAAAESWCPVAARRAQALLGGKPLLDAVDLAIVAAVRGHARWSSIISMDAMPANRTSPWRTGWGVDLLRCQIWLPDGRRADLLLLE